MATGDAGQRASQVSGAAANQPKEAATGGAGFELPTLPEQGAGVGTGAVVSVAAGTPLPPPATPRATPALSPRLTLPATRRGAPAPHLRSPGSIPDDLPADSPARAPTLTAQMRAIQPPDVAKQAISEMNVLARELIALPALLEASGLAPTNRRSYLDTLQTYSGLAQIAWEAVAEERLEQSGAEAAHRQQAIAVARRVSQLQHECRTLSSNSQFQLPRKRPAQWRRRVALANKGIHAWQDRIAPTPDPLLMGRGLLMLRGYLGLAVAGRLELALLSLLTGTTLTLLVLAALGAGFTIAAGLAGSGADLIAVIAGFAALFAWLFTLLLSNRGPLPLGMLLGATVFSPTRTTRNVGLGSRPVAALLRAWWLLMSLAAMLAALAALALGVRAVVLEGLPTAPPANAIQATSLAAHLLAVVFAPAAAVSFAGFVLLALPAYLLAALRSASELRGGASWVADARRYALGPALGALTFVTIVLAAGVWLATTTANWQQHALAVARLGDADMPLTLRGLALFLVLALPYLLLLELPYRLGTWTWRRGWLRDLAERRADVESHVRRLSVPDPESGTQDTSDENLRAMQYDLVLLQFYQGKLDEVRRTPSGPFALFSLLAALVLFAVTALLLDAGGPSLARLILGG
ncbi:MAG TPA: hypothetical protein VFU88_16960 [Ktedonobacterales bacterium]|nr:hypothetical protein [Ktedonobacterales bacterium]